MATKEQDDNSSKPLESVEALPKTRRGRPAGAGILPHLKDLIENCGRGRKYAETLDQLAIRSKSDTIKLAAIKEITDRVHGKSIQAIAFKGIISEEAMEAMMPAESTMSTLDEWAGDDDE